MGGVRLSSRVAGSRRSPFLAITFPSRSHPPSPPKPASSGRATMITLPNYVGVSAGLRVTAGRRMRQGAGSRQMQAERRRAGKPAAGRRFDEGKGPTEVGGQGDEEARRAGEDEESEKVDRARTRKPTKSAEKRLSRWLVDQAAANPTVDADLAP